MGKGIDNAGKSAGGRSAPAFERDGKNAL